jgi:hypothetical protein
MSLQGTLKTLGITEVLEFLSARSVTGRLDVHTEMGTATYVMVNGLVAEGDYSFIRESGSDAAEATYYVVSELDGTFFFDEEDQVPDEDADTVGHEDVGSVLSRTAGIAESWHEIEATIPSPNHLLTRNNELDGSVTIQPEWWKALEMIGEGRTSLQLATALELSALDASLTALAMTQAGLLIVSEMDPLEIDVETSFGEMDEQYSYSAEEVRDPEQQDVVSEEVSHERVEMLDVVDVAEPFPPIKQFTVPEVEEEAPSLPELQQVEAPEPEPAPAIDDYAGASSMDDLSELEYMVESDGFAPAATAEAIHEPAALTPEEPREAAYVPPVDDDGWSTDHSASNAQLQPFTDFPAVSKPVVEHIEATEPTPFDVVDVPTEADEAPSAEAMPIPESAPAMSLDDLPAPPPAEDMLATSAPAHEAPIGVPEAPMPVPEVMAPAGATEFVDAAEATAASTAIAGAVIDDLATLTDELDATDPGENWQLDDTFVPDPEPAPAPILGDPFGDLGDLLTDSSDDEERSSVLKFLRRD